MKHACDKQLLSTCSVTINSMIASPPPTFHTHAASKWNLEKALFICALQIRYNRQRLGLSKKSIT